MIRAEARPIPFAFRAQNVADTRDAVPYEKVSELVRKASEAHELERWRDCVLVCESILEMAPTQKDALFFGAHAYYELGECKRCREMIEAAAFLPELSKDEFWMLVALYELASPRLFAGCHSPAGSINNGLAPPGSKGALGVGPPRG